MKSITLSEFFHINGIEKIVEQEIILEIIGSKAPSALWNHIHITAAQKTLLGKVHRYQVETPQHRNFSEEIG